MFIKTTIAWAALAALSVTVAAQGQPPSDAPGATNLRVLPRTMGREPLVAVMREFTAALGVKCDHCHTAVRPDDISTYNFASDDKRPKQTARLMMRMNSDINFRYLPDIGAPRSAGANVVTCYTCHRGELKPKLAP